MSVDLITDNTYITQEVIIYSHIFVKTTCEKQSLVDGYWQIKETQQRS